MNDGKQVFLVIPSQFLP